MDSPTYEALEKTKTRFIKLLQSGIPRESVRESMIARGLDKTLIHAVLDHDSCNSSESSESPKPVHSPKDSIVESVIQQFLARSEVGKKKYGTTLDRSDLKPLDWIQHTQEELMDAILYLEKLKQEHS
jgi:hypothetical protein